MFWQVASNGVVYKKSYMGLSFAKAVDMQPTQQFSIASFAILAVSISLIAHGLLLQLSDFLVHLNNLPIFLLSSGFGSVVFCLTSMVAMNNRQLSPKWVFPTGTALVLLSACLGAIMLMDQKRMLDTETGRSSLYIDHARLFAYAMKDYGMCSVELAAGGLPEFACANAAVGVKLIPYAHALDPEELDECLAYEAELSEPEPKTKQARLFACHLMKPIILNWASLTYRASLHQFVNATALALYLILAILLMRQRPITNVTTKRQTLT